jgi:hypothetical protein
MAGSLAVAVGTEAGAAPADAQTTSAGVHTTAMSCPTTFDNQTPVVGIAPAPGASYWEVDQNGEVGALGGAPCYGSAPAHLNQPIVGMAATPDGHGYWLVAADGGVFAFGDAGFYGSTGGIHLNQPIVGMAATPDGHGYWLVAADGGVFAFGDAGFYGSTGDMRLTQPVTGIAPTPDGHGYFLVARDGGIFSYGDAVFHGSMGGQHLAAPVVGAALDPATGGYWLVASDGGVFSFDAPFHGSPAGRPIPAPATAISVTAGGAGYRIVGADGHVYAYPLAAYAGQVSLPPGTLRCLSSQMAFRVVSYQARLGNVAAAVSLTNQSSSSCALDGYPGVGLVSPQDAIMAVSTDRGPDYLFADAGPSALVLDPGQSAYFDVGYTDMPLGQPSSSVLEIDVPNGTNPMFLDTASAVRAYPNPDHINVNAVHPAPAFPAAG